MGFQFNWLLQDRVVFVKASGRITDEDVLALDRISLELLETTPNPQLHFIFDNSDITQQAKITVVAKMRSPHHEKTGWIVQYGSKTTAMMFLMTAFAQLFRLTQRTVQNLDEALDILQAADHDLPDLRTLIAERGVVESQIS